jgi:hypothetical protein
VERLLSALGQKDRLRIVLWLIEGGPARQVEICQRLAIHRNRPVNPGEVSALLKPLLESGILVRERERPRGPIDIRDRQQLVRLLQTAAELSLGHAQSSHSDAENDSDELRRAILHQIPGSNTGSG